VKRIWQERARTRVAASVVVVAVAIGAEGCKGCGSEPVAEPTVGVEAAAPSPDDKAAAPTPTEPAAAAAAEPAAKPAAAEPPTDYDGPRSENGGGFKVTSGFADASGKPLSQPKALEAGRVFVTALDSGNHPLGKLDVFGGAELHGFLLARDLRQAYYADGSGAVAPGADARALDFVPREGGEHALVLVFRPVGEAPQAVATPVVIKGNLPKVAGPGTRGVPLRLRRPSGDLELVVTPPQPVAGAEVRLSGRRYDAAGADKGGFGLPWAVRCTPGFGRCEVIEGDREGVIAFRPDAAGDSILLMPDHVGRAADAPPIRAGEARNATVFGLTVLPAPAAEAKP
jgi:hypothetical protein